MKKAAYVLLLVLYPFLTLAIAAGCLENCIYQADIHDIYRKVILLSSALCLLVIHYLLFARMAKKCSLEPVVHLLCSTFLLGIDAAPFLYVTVVCIQKPLLILLQVILLGVRIFYTVRQLRRYQKSGSVEKTA